MNGQPGQPQQSNKPEEKKLEVPPQQELGVRSMGSDISSIQRGEVMPVPESVLPPENTKEPVFRPETQVGEIPMVEEAREPKSKKPLLWVVLGVVVIGLGLVGYFVVYPLLSSPSSTQPVEPPPGQIITSIVHSSFFLGTPQATADITLNNLLTSTITNELQNLSLNRLSDGAVQEVVMHDAEGGQVPFGSFGAALIPSLTSTQLSSWFEDDFTAFLFYDLKGVWPGYIARIKNGINLDEVKINVTALESSDLSKFYLTPGVSFGPFAGGQVFGQETRYSVGSVPGAALNHGIINNYLVISTSYDGLKVAVPLLGL